MTPRIVAHDRAKWSEWMLGLGAALAIAALWSSWQQLQLVQDLARGANVPDSVIEMNDERQQLFAYLQLGSGIGWPMQISHLSHGFMHDTCGVQRGQAIGSP